MASLSNEPLAVHDGVMSISSQALTSTYRQVILYSAEAFNNIVQSCDGASPKKKVSAASEACTILFGERAIVSGMLSYGQEQQRNWSS
jgi:hypothetical protein